MAKLPTLISEQPEIEAQVFHALEAERAMRPPKSGLYLSGIGDCPRKQWALRRGEAPEDLPGEVLANFEVGNAVEDLVVGLLERAGYQIRDRQMRLVMDLGDGLVASGRIDGIIKLKRENAILEIKSAKEEQFEMAQTVGYRAWQPKYAATLDCYMGASGIPVGLAVVFNKGHVPRKNRLLYAERLRLDVANFERMRARARLVMSTESAPIRPDDATSRFCQFCKYCHLNARCWGPTWDAKFDE